MVNARLWSSAAVVVLPAVWIAAVSLTARGQESSKPEAVTIPPTATTLEGLPTVRVVATEQGVTRSVLGQAEAQDSRLLVKKVDGQLRWVSRDNRPLSVVSTGEYTYLASEPGHYIRLTRVKDRISYVEHVESTLRSVTFWGELRIVGD